jgi:hypothetical protein
MTNGQEGASGVPSTPLMARPSEMTEKGSSFMAQVFIAGVITTHH